MKTIILIIAGCYLLKRSGTLTDFLKRFELKTTRAAPVVTEKVEPQHPPETIPQPLELTRDQLEGAALATMKRYKVKSAPVLVKVYSDSELYQIIQANRWILND